MSSVNKIGLCGQFKWTSFDKFMSMNKQDDVKREYHDGNVIEMNSPGRWHQDVVAEVYSQLREQFDGRICNPMLSRDVHLKVRGSSDVLYIPDVLLLCDESVDDGQTIHGAPYLVVEVWSPSNTASERKRKVQHYLQSGVTEVWSIDNKTCTVYTVSGDVSITWLVDDIESATLPGVIVNLSEYADKE